jgi:phosphohistidine phosphatase
VSQDERNLGVGLQESSGVMRISLLRHGIAVDRGTPGYDDDSQRPLTAKGERRMRRAAEGILALKLSYDLMLSSPYRRAQQTADIVAQVLTISDGPRLVAALTPDGDPRQLLEELRSADHTPQNIMLVGHEPYLSRLCSTLLTGNPNLSVAMRKGGLCTLELDTLRFGRCAQLIWLLTPRQLRRLA